MLTTDESNIKHASISVVQRRQHVFPYDVLARRIRPRPPPLPPKSLGDIGGDIRLVLCLRRYRLPSWLDTVASSTHPKKIGHTIVIVPQSHKTGMTIAVSGGTVPVDQCQSYQGVGESDSHSLRGLLDAIGALSSAVGTRRFANLVWSDKSCDTTNLTLAALSMQC